MNVFHVSGNLGANAEVRTTNSGTVVVGFPVAFTSGFGQNKKTEWLKCSLFGNRGTALEPYLAKGVPVSVCGELSLNEYNGKTYLQLRVMEISLMGRASQGHDQNARQQATQAAYQQQQPNNGGQQGGMNSNAAPHDDFDDDLPF